MFKKESQHAGVRCSLLGRCLLWVFCAAFAATAQAQNTANVNFKTTYQTFEGWGTSLAWWANVVGGYPDANRTDYMKRVFDPTYGLGLNVVRYNIGGGENPKYLAPNTQYLQYRANMPGFLASATAQYDWTQDANQRWVLQQSIQQGVTVAEAFSNSPPWWMTNSGSVTGANDGGNNLNPAYSSAFADYLTTVAQHYHDTWGITFRTLEPFNEPAAWWWKFGGVQGGSTQEGCGFDTATQNSFAKTLGAALAKKNMSYTTVSASDENSIDQAVISLSAMDSNALDAMSQVNTHSYNGSNRATLMANAATAGKRLWMSEYGDGDGTGMTMAAQIVSDLKGMQPKSWIYWQAVEGLNGDGSPSGWGLMNTKGLDGSSNYGYTFNEKYYVMANFSKFIRPGYQFIGMDDANSVAAYDGNGTLAIVTINNTNTEQQVTYNLQNVPAAMGSGPWNVQAYRTSSTENLVAQPPFYVSGTNFYYNIPANSVTSFVVTGASIDPNVAANTPVVVDGGQYVIYTQWNYPGDSNVQALQETNRVSGQAQEAPGVQLVTDGTWCNGVLGCSSIDHARVWVAHSAGSNNWVFTNLHSEDKGTPLAMEITGITDGSKVIQNPRTDGPNQLWTVQPAGDNGYRLIPATSNLSLHMDGNNGWWGGGVYLCTEADASCNDTWPARYEWHLVPFQGSAMSTSLAISYPSAVTTATNLKLNATLKTNGGSFPTGTVTFYDGTNELGQATLSGSSNTVSFAAGSLTAGTHSLSATYSGDSSNLSSAAEASLNVSPLMPTTTTLTSSATSLVAGQSVTFTATVSTASGSAPSGTMTFAAGSTTLAAVPVTGNIVTYTTSSLTAGAYSVVANYSGDSANGASSSSAVLVMVTAAGTSTSNTTMTFSPAAPIVGTPITLSATVTGKGAAPTGSVYFTDGSTVVGSTPVGSGGTASITTSKFAVGAHSLTAFYTGDAAYSSSTSSVTTAQVYAVPVGDYTLASSVNAVELNGKSAKAYISIATSGGFNQPITLSCSGLPAGYSCFFSPATVTPTGSANGGTQLIIGTSNAASLGGEQSPGHLRAALAGLCFFGLPFLWRFRRNLKGSMLILLVVGALGLFIGGCNATTKKNYTVTITGTSLPLTHAITIQVNQ